MNKINKKLKKLVRDPKLFFEDMYKKRKLKLDKYIRTKKEGNKQYTVISAVYNVEKYLNEYFSSLTRQKLNFKKNITLILVDDGSTDNSANIIKKWQKKFPKNIYYFYKENGGQSSARNLGLKHVQTEWVTFIDPDDFISPNYFFEVDNLLTNEEDIALVSTPIAVYKEDKNSYSYNTAPLSYCFKDKEKKFPIKNLGNKIQLSVCTALFKTEVIKSHKLSFNEKIKPAFEDGKFVADYLLVQDNLFVYFLDNVNYFYRTRQDNSSTTNGQWLKKEKYLNVLKYGYIRMFEEYKRTYGYIPVNIQHTFLYFAIQYIKLILNNTSSISFLEEDEKNEFEYLFYECFKYIDKKNIMQFHLHGCSIFYKSGMINLFKKENVDFMMVYIEKIDHTNNLIELYFNAPDDTDIEYYVDNQYVTPTFRKEKSYDFLNGNFINTYRVWLPIEHISKEIEITSKCKVKIVYDKKEFNNKLSLSTVKVSHPLPIKGNPWIFIDKEIKADDNAEHLYRYISKNHPEQPVYFVLKKSSSDWDRLSKEGFKLLDFGSQNFENIYKESSVIFSSHCDKYFTEYFGRNTLENKKFVFLQHGVIMHDLSEWLNNVPKIDIFCTSTLPEYTFIGGEVSPYKYSHEVKLTGLARHDSLLEKSKQYQNPKNIMVMPTWRNYIVGRLIPGKVSREINTNFKETDYFKHWYQFLHSKELKQLLDEHNYTLTFVPHPNIIDYLDLFELPSYIENPANIKGFSIQECLAKSELLITDYSSITFDMAFLGRNTLYYQFDADTFFAGGHTSHQGYFSYKDNGFGPISSNLQELLSQLEGFIIKDKKLINTYQARLENLYPNRDGKNCEAIYKEVVSLDKAIPDSQQKNIILLKDFIAKSESKKMWDVTSRRSIHLLNLQKGNNSNQDYNQYLNALFMDNKFYEILNFIEKQKIRSNLGKYWCTKVYMQIGHIEHAISQIVKSDMSLIEDKLIALLYSAYLQKSSYKKLLKSLTNKIDNNFYKKLKGIAERIYFEDFVYALQLIDSLLSEMTLAEKRLFKLELLASYLCMHIFKFDHANKYLIKYEKHTRNDPSCRVAIARLAQKNHDLKKLVDQADKAFGEYIELLPEDLYVSYLSGLDDAEKSAYLLDKWLKNSENNMALNELKISILFKENKWSEIIETLKYNENFDENIAYMYISSLLKVGKINEANTLIKSRTNKENYFYWKLAAEAAEKNRDFETLKICLEHQLKLTDSLK